jgi:hypothetical protein
MTDSLEHSFTEVARLIQSARERALQAVNTGLIDLYWQVGEYISRKIETAAWGEGVVDQLASYLFRMRQFFEVYRHHEKVSPLVRQLPWTHNIMILGKCKLVTICDHLA